LNQTKIDKSFIEFLKNKFIKNCTAFGTPKGVILQEDGVKMRHEDE